MSEFVPLKAHVKIAKGKPPAGIPYSGKGAQPYLNPEYLRGNGEAVLAKSRSDSIVAAEGDTVVLWDGSNAGEFFRAKPGIVASTMAQLVCDDTLDPGYFYHAAKHSEWFLKGQTNGTGIPHVDREILESLSLFRPPGLPQRVIARILDTLDTQIEKTQALIAKLEQVKEGLLHDLITRGVDENGELRPSAEEAPELYKESALGLIPSQWLVAKIGDIADLLYGPAFESANFVDHGSGIRLMRGINVSRGFIRWDPAITAKWRADDTTYARYELAEGDVVIGMDGALVGRNVAQVGASDLPALLVQRVARIRAVPHRATWIRFNLQHPRFLAHIDNTKTHTAIPHIAGRDISEYQIAVPPDCELASAIEILHSTERDVSHEKQSLAAILSLKSGLMDDLLTGRVRVTTLLETEQPAP